ncbi:consortin isoform X3 [Genypterus blacodes]|uniref:consortin isoform X3 n=1 Tax=Genypterus blacodes TaxID=154954 RepID=UPI003F770402
MCPDTKLHVATLSGQCEREGRVMSQFQGVDVCDNLLNPDCPAVQHRNLNETNALTQGQSDGRGSHQLIQSNSLNDNGGEDEEEEDHDEVMKEAEEEVESEESSCLIRCQSPDTPMTDSSYSESGSLLEAPYPLSPGTSPEPTSSTIPVASPENASPSSQAELSQCDARMDSNNSNTGSPPVSTCTPEPSFATGPTDSAAPLTSDTRHANTVRPVCVTEGTARLAKSTSPAAEPLTSPTELNITSGSPHTEQPCDWYEEPSKVISCSTTLATSLASVPASSTTELVISTTEPIATGTGPTFTTGPVTSSTALPTCPPVPSSATGPIPNPAPLPSLEQLAQRGDDTHLPQYLHQIAEAYVLHEDYQQALRCLQLERLYHQRILDNLNTLQDQWESQSRRTSSDLETQPLDILKHICQTHNRPRAKDAACTSLDFLRVTFEEERLSGPLPSSSSANQVKGGAEQSSQLVNPHTTVDGRLPLEKSEKNRADPDQEPEGRAPSHGSQLTDKKASDRGGGELEGGVEYTITVRGNGLHPSTSAEMDQSKPAALQGGEIGPTQENKVKEEEGDREVEEAAEAVEMEDEGEDEEEKKGQSLPEEALLSEPEVEAPQLQEEAPPEEEQYGQTQLHQETQQPEQGEEEKEEDYDEYEYGVERVDIIGEAASLDDLAKLITIQEAAPSSGLVSILKKRGIHVDNVCVSASLEPQADKPPGKRRVRFRVPDDGYEQVGGGDSCLLLFLLCLVTVVISIGGTAVYCALGDAHSSVCQDFSRNADFYITQVQRGMAQLQYWFAPGS